MDADVAAWAAVGLELMSELVPGCRGDGEMASNGPVLWAEPRPPHMLLRCLSALHPPPPTLHSKELPQCLREPDFSIFPTYCQKAVLFGTLSHLFLDEVS